MNWSYVVREMVWVSRRWVVLIEPNRHRQESSRLELEPAGEAVGTLSLEAKVS